MLNFFLCSTGATLALSACLLYFRRKTRTVSMWQFIASVAVAIMVAALIAAFANPPHGPRGNAKYSPYGSYTQAARSGSR